jgi:hypothetical protein
MNLAPIAAQNSECPIDTSYILVEASRFAIDDLKRPDVGQESGEKFDLPIWASELASRRECFSFLRR